MTDTHTHLYMSDSFAGDEGAAAVRRAIGAGVGMMVFPGVDMKSVKSMMELHREFPDHTVVAMGLHPTELTPGYQATLEEMEKMLAAGGFAAVGEAGIDLHWDSSTLQDQKKAFAIQYGWAQKYNLPLIIHSRDAREETLDVIASAPGPQPAMVFHSFTGSADDVRRIREVCDPYFGINGVVTFKNAAALREAVPEIGIDRIMLETDSPYLAPAPHRGSRNESSYIPLIRDCVASTLGISPEETERITDRNAADLFSLQINKI